MTALSRSGLVEKLRKPQKASLPNLSQSYRPSVMIRVGPHVARVREVRLLTALVDAWVVRGCRVGGEMRVALRMKEGVSGAADA